MAHMIDNDLLMAYRNLNGICGALKGIESRLKRASRLKEAMVDLELNYDSFGADFATFFPDLIAYARKTVTDMT